jgi:hypothetical protein
MAPKTILLVLLVSALELGDAVAQGAPSDPLTKFVADMIAMHEGKTLCTGNSMLPSVRAGVVEELKTMTSGGTATIQMAGVALWIRYPCPFAPFRPELRPASKQDIEGVWLFPESSQKLRFGPRSDRQLLNGRLPVKCDAVGYYPGGELRHGVIAGQVACPFRKAADLDVARKNPRVSYWSLLRDGRVSVSRTDVQNHIEEWDVYAVTTPFDFEGIQFKEGDLVAYVRRENGNEVSAATQFRHLQRLP